jgi:uncharacterized protein (DUF488 family)
MQRSTPAIIYTIGHSTRSLEEFIVMLQSFNIEVLVDIRHYPGSRRYPHFNKQALEISLPEQDIQYVHLESLGGRRKPVAGSPNTAWRNDAFRGYADYMETPPYKEGIKALTAIAERATVAFMCSEAVWWRCHRSLVADYLKLNGWKVMHIMGTAKADEHPYTSAASVVNGKLSYAKETGEGNGLLF